MKKIENKTDKLIDLADFTLGITPYDKYRGYDENTIKNRLFHSSEKLTEDYKPLITGENINRYFIFEYIKEYIKYGDWLGAKREERFFKKPRILIRQIISGEIPRIYSVYTDKEFYFTQIGFALISKNQQINNLYLLTLINSKLLNFYHKYKFLDLEKQLFQKILIANCKLFPIKNISLNLQKPFIEKAELMLELNEIFQEKISKFISLIIRKFEIERISKKLNDWYKLEFNDFIKELKKLKIKLTLKEEVEWEEYFTECKKEILEIKNQIDETDKIIDKMVYSLYDLTTEEIDVIERS